MIFRHVAMLFCLSAATLFVQAQQEPCGLRTMIETAAPIYPPIARAAHVSGDVIMLASFKTTGEVGAIDVISGPMMLRAAATDYVYKWRANEYTGPRTCPIVVHFLLSETLPTNPPVRLDLQHVTVYGQFFIISDPAFTITRRKRFWLF